MRNRPLAVWLACLAAILLILLLRHKSGRSSDGANGSAPLTAKTSTATATATPGTPANNGGNPIGSSMPPSSAGPSSVAPSVSPIAARPAAPIARGLEFTNFPPATVLENLRTVFHSYSSALGGNPTGTNPEITAALRGENPKQTNFLKEEEGQRVNEKGELIDPWGTPYFFHALSGTEMEIHSAGPDGVMWTADDLVTK